MNELLLRRVAARCIDAFTVLFLTFGAAVSVLVLAMDPLTRALDVGPWGQSLAPLLLYCLISIVYETVFTARCGQTPGKDLLKVRVVDAATGELPGWPSATGRAVVMALPRLVPGVVIGTIAVFGYAAPVPASGGRGVQDLLCGTRVEFHDATAESEDRPDWESSTAGLAHQYGPRSWWHQVFPRLSSGDQQ